MIAGADDLPIVSQEFDVMLCWLNERTLVPNGKYALRHTTKDVRCIVKEIKYKLDINTMDQLTEDKEIRMNDIARVTLRTTQPLVYDSYRQNRNTGSLILIDEATNTTVGAGMIV